MSDQVVGRKMAQISFVAMCGGVVTKTSQKTGKPYQMTNFVVERPDGTRQTMDLFGDLGLSRTDSFGEYVLAADIKDLSFPVLVSAPKEKVGK